MCYHLMESRRNLHQFFESRVVSCTYNSCTKPNLAKKKKSKKRCPKCEENGGKIRGHNLPTPPLHFKSPTKKNGVRTNTVITGDFKVLAKRARYTPQATSISSIRS